MFIKERLVLAETLVEIWTLTIWSGPVKDNKLVSEIDYTFRLKTWKDVEL